MQNISKISKISILISVLLLCAVVIYAIFNEREIKTDNYEKQAGQVQEKNSNVLDKAKTAENKIVRKINDTEYILGNFNASVQIIVYDDFDNQFSADYFLALKEVSSYFDGKIAIVFRHFPMRSHQNSIVAALASECAGEQDLFWEIAEKLFKAKAEGELTEEYIFILGEDAGVDEDAFAECMRTEKYLEKIQNSITEAKGLNVIGVPTTFINSIPYPGAYQFEDFVDSAGIERKGLKSIIKDELAKS